MGILYILQLFWFVAFGFIIIATFILTVFWNICSSPQIEVHHQCIDLTQFCMYTVYYIYCTY